MVLVLFCGCWRCFEWFVCACASACDANGDSRNGFVRKILLTAQDACFANIVVIRSRFFS